MSVQVQMLGSPLITQIIERFGDKVAVAFSGGHCSLVILHMAWQIDPHIKVVFHDTTNEYPETVEFVRRVAGDWNLNLTVTKPEKTWAECYKQYGPPGLRGQGKHRTPRCCYWLKEKPAKLYYRQHGIECALDGIRMEESWQRYCFGKQFGPLHYSKRWGMWKAHPILHWIGEDLQEYIRIHNLPQNPMYARGLRRIGCRGCTAFIGWERVMVRQSPKLYSWVQQLKGQRILEGAT